MSACQNCGGEFDMPDWAVLMVPIGVKEGETVSGSFGDRLVRRGEKYLQLERWCADCGWPEGKPVDQSKPLCSICRRRHGSEIKHSNE